MIRLYREGDSHLIDGIPCEVGLFNHIELSDQLDNGWSESVDDVKIEVNDDIESSINPVRLRAKEAGIEGWDKRRIKKLEAELNGCTEEG